MAPEQMKEIKKHITTEVGRDNEAAGGSNADSSQPAPDSPPIQTPEVPNTEAITPTAPTEGPSA